MHLKQKSGLFGTLSAGLGHVFWGFSYLFTRVGQRCATPTQLLAIRFTVAFALLNLLLLTGKEKLSFRGKNCRPLFLLCACELSCFFFESYGLYYTNATISGIFVAASPIAAIFLSIVFLRERPTKAQALCSLLPIAGVIVISAAGSSLGEAAPIGIACLLAYCFSSGAYKTVNRSASRDFTPFERTYALLASCCVVFTCISLFQLRGNVSAFLAPVREPDFLMSVLALSVLCSIVANMLVNLGSGAISVTKMAALGAVSTVCSTFAGVVFLHEPITVAILLGAALIIVGVWQVTVRGE